MAAFALLLVIAARGSSGTTTAPTAIATSSTTAEEARAIDGPFMRYPETSSISVGLATLLQGVLQSDVNHFAGRAAWNLAGRCLDTGQIAVVENAGTAIGPSNT